MPEAPLLEPLLPPDLLRGGILFRMLRRLGVDIVEARRVSVRAATIALVVWAPMAAMCLMDGTLLPGRVGMPFLYDVAAYARPLVTIPLLVAAEPVLAGAWRTALQRLLSRGIVLPDQIHALNLVVARAIANRDRVVPEIVCALLAALAAASMAGAVVAAGSSAWFAAGEPGSAVLSAAGLWYVVVVLGGGCFLLLRWVWRIIVWHVLLYRISRLPLHLSPVHPDRACGLEFLCRPIEACALLAFALTAAVAGRFANLMLHHEASLMAFAVPGGVFCGVVLLLLLLPTGVIFAPLLLHARRDALVEIGALATQCGDPFVTWRGDPKAVVPGAAPPSLQDVYTAVDAIRGIRPVPMDLSTVIILVLAFAVPALGLALLEIPAGDILDRIAKLIL